MKGILFLLTALFLIGSANALANEPTEDASSAGLAKQCDRPVNAL